MKLILTILPPALEANLEVQPSANNARIKFVPEVSFAQAVADGLGLGVPMRAAQIRATAAEIFAGVDFRVEICCNRR